MKTLLTAIAFLLSVYSYSQQNLIFPVGVEYSIDWKGVEKKVARPIVDKFIKDNPYEFHPYRQKGPDASFYNLDSLRNALHFLDLNGDGKLDVVFFGLSGSEAQMVELFINTGQTYKNVFATQQGIVKMDWQDNRLTKLYIDDWGCCDDYLVFHKIYEVRYDSKLMPAFKQIYQSVSVERYHNGVIPDSLLEKPFRFEIENEGYKIRCAPKIEDSSPRPWDDADTGNGNSIGRLEKGATGTAIARKVDATGREWLYVEMDEQYLPKNDIIYVENKFPTRLVGWVSGRFIKEI